MRKDIKMLKNIILIENENDYQCDSYEDVVKYLIEDTYYQITPQEKKEKIKMRALANCLGNNYEILENASVESDITNKIIIDDERSYILSLLTTNKIVLLEKIDSNIFTKSLDKASFEKNYIIVNTFAKELLLKYLSERKTPK